MNHHLRLPAMFFVVMTTNGSLMAQTLRLVPDQYPGIQAAIDAATSGDEIVVRPGLYQERLDFLGKRLAVRGDAGPALTTIDRSGIGPPNQLRVVVTMTSGEPSGTILEGFTITGGEVGVAVGNGASPLVRGCVIRGNARFAGPNGGATGGGIHVMNATPTIERCRIEDNLLCAEISTGGGVAIEGGVVTLRSTAILRNQANATAGLCGFGGAAASGGGIAVGPGTLVLDGCTLADNSRDGMASNLSVDVGAAASGDHCIVWHPGGSAGIEAVGGSVVFSRSDIAGGWPGSGNLVVDPRFAADGWHLLADSPCIQAGTPGVAPLDLDLDGDPRELYLVRDLGADEWRPPRSLSLLLGQPSGAGSFAVSVEGGAPFAPYVGVFSIDPRNQGPSSGLGSIGGVHIAIADLVSELQSGAAPFRGLFDAQGRLAFGVPAGALVVLSGTTVLAVVHTLDPATSALLAATEPTPLVLN